MIRRDENILSGIELIGPTYILHRNHKCMKYVIPEYFQIWYGLGDMILIS